MGVDWVAWRFRAVWRSWWVGVPVVLVLGPILGYLIGRATS